MRSREAERSDCLDKQYSDRVNLWSIEIRQTGELDDEGKYVKDSEGRIKRITRCVVSTQTRAQPEDDEPQGVIQSVYEEARLANRRIDLQGYDCVILSNHRKMIPGEAGVLQIEKLIRLDEVRLFHAPADKR